MIDQQGDFERALSEALGEERELQREAENDIRPEDRELAASFMAEHMASERPASRLRRWAPLLAAAAVLLLWASWQWNQQEPQRPVRVGSTGIELLAPEGDAERWPILRWEGELPRGATWRLIVESHDETGAWVKRIEAKLEVGEYTPTSDERVLLSDEIRWKVDCLEAGMSSGWQESSLNED